LPLVHVSFKYRPNRRPVVARGVIAIGQFACGVVCIAQFSVGLLSISQFTVAAFAAEWASIKAAGAAFRKSRRCIGFLLLDPGYSPAATAVKF